MKKTIFTAILLIAAVLLSSAGGAKETEGANAGPVTIELWSSLTGAKARVFDEQATRYNASQQKVQVQVVHQGGYMLLRQKVAAAANADKMPTVIIVDYTDVGYYAQLGLIAEISPILPKEVINDYYPAMLADLKIKDKLYAIPYNRSTQGFFVNNDVLKKAGIENPAKNWTEFLEQSKKFRRLGKDYYYGYAFFHQFLFDAIACTWGAQISSPDGKVLLNSPEMVNMMTYFQNMYKDGLLLMQPVLVGGFEEQNGAFLAGNVATVFQTSSFIPTAQSLLKYNWSFEFVPSGKGGNAITIGGANFAVTSRAGKAQVQAAGDFLNYMSSPDIVAEFFMKTGNLPVRQSIMNRADIKEFLAKNPPYVKMIEQLKYGKGAPSITKNIRDVFGRVNDMIARVILKGENVQTVLDEYTKIFQQECDEAKALGEFIY